MLAVLTLLVVIQVAGESALPTSEAQNVADAGTTLHSATTGSTNRATTASGTSGSLTVSPDPTDRDAEGQIAGTIAAGALPDGPPFTAAGSGAWHVVPGTSPTVGTGSRALTYTVEVEDGLPAELDQQFAQTVDATLADPRSWIGDGQVSFTRIDNGDPDIRISLTNADGHIRCRTTAGGTSRSRSSQPGRWMARKNWSTAR